MNLTLPNPKVGYTSIDGTTNDMNTSLIKADCGCAGSSERYGACSCPIEPKFISVSDIKLETISFKPPTNTTDVISGRLTPVPDMAVTANNITVTNPLNGLMDKVKALYASNPSYFYIGGAVALYLMTKKKGKKLF